jgi:hypothetical protein
MILMRYDYTLTQPKKIPMSLASRKLSPETLDALVRFYASEHMKVSTDLGYLDPAITFSQWVRECLSEKKLIAEKCIQRFLWHMEAGTITRFGHASEYIVGLLQFDQSDKVASLSRDQETAIMKLEMRLNRLGQKSRGVSSFIRYGEGLKGTKLLYERLGDFVLENPERIDDICWIIKERNFTNLKDIKPMLESMAAKALTSGVL